MKTLSTIFGIMVLIFSSFAAAEEGCKYDTQCKGERICVKGECVDQPSKSNGLESPSGSSAPSPNQPPPKAVESQSESKTEKEHLFVGEWMVADDKDSILAKGRWSIKFEGDNYTVNLIDSALCRSPDHCEVSQVKYGEDELFFTVTKTLRGRSYPQSIAQCYVRLSSDENDKIHCNCKTKKLAYNSRNWSPNIEERNFDGYRSEDSSPPSAAPSIREPTSTAPPHNQIPTMPSSRDSSDSPQSSTNRAQNRSLNSACNEQWQQCNSVCRMMVDFCSTDDTTCHEEHYRKVSQCHEDCNRDRESCT